MEHKGAVHREIFFCLFFFGIYYFRWRIGEWYAVFFFFCTNVCAHDLTT